MKFNKILLPVCLLAGLCVACGFFGSADGLYPVLKNGKWGYIDNQGKIVVEPQFYKAQDFADGLALVVVQGKDANNVGFIDRTGKFVIEPKLPVGSFAAYQKELGSVSFSDNLQWVLANDPKDKTIIFDKTGRTVFELEAGKIPVGSFSDGLLLVRSRKKDSEFSDDNYYYDTSGKVAFKADNWEANPFRDGLARIHEASDFEGYIDKTGKTVIPPKYKKAFDFSEGLARVSEDGSKFFFIDKTGKQIGEKQFDEAGDFHDGLAFAKQGMIWGYIDNTGIWAFTPRFSGLKPNNFSEGLAVVFEKGAFQIIDRSGKSVAALDSAVSSEKVNDTIVGEFKNGIARIIHSLPDGDNRIIYFNRKGKIIWNEKGQVKF